MRKLTGPPQWRAQDHPYRRVRLNGNIVIIDELLVDVVKALNRAGAQTDFCCQGNHHAHDDRKHIHSHAYISVSRKSSLPDSLIELATSRGFQSSKHYLCATPKAFALPPVKVRANNRRFIRMLNEWTRTHHR